VEHSNENHPVWDVYNEYRTARLNIKYLEKQLIYLRRKNSIIEFSLAFSASSGFASLWIWQGAIGGVIWKVIGLITAVLAIVKPILKLPNKISEKEELLTGYKTLHYDLEKIIRLINQTHNYDENLQKQFNESMERKGILVLKDNESTDEKLRNQCESEVIKELPSNQFYIPRSDLNAKPKSTSSKSSTTKTTTTTKINASTTVANSN
jgi:hypothetical protein